jgi:acetolactate synthase-1/3 small subunit
VAQLFAARGFNIEALTVGPTHDETMSRMTIVVKGNDTLIEQVKKQLNKLVEVVAISNLAENGSFVTREIMLIKVACTPENRMEILQIGELFHAEAIDYTPGSLTFELVGKPEKLDNFITFVQNFGVMELSRSGVVGMNRGVGGLQTEFQAAAEEKAV